VPLLSIAGTLLGVAQVPAQRDALAVALGIAVRLHREDRGWSREALAYRAGLEPQSMGPLEDGEGTPTLAVTFKVAAGLELAPTELVRAAEELMK
jgi:transcriptional regulator with XRE-family HTH domain